MQLISSKAYIKGASTFTLRNQSLDTDSETN